MTANLIERKPNSRKYRVVGKGVTVEYLSRLIDDPNWPVERICANYRLTPAEIYAAWAFYYAHQEEIDRTLADDTAAWVYTAEDEARREALLARRKPESG
jgi:uncharacterized protein (DUF433 family)